MNLYGRAESESYDGLGFREQGEERIISIVHCCFYAFFVCDREIWGNVVDDDDDDFR
jgi:hypothetical protein